MSNEMSNILGILLPRKPVARASPLSQIKNGRSVSVWKTYCITLHCVALPLVLVWVWREFRVWVTQSSLSCSNYTQSLRYALSSYPLTASFFLDSAKTLVFTCMVVWWCRNPSLRVRKRSTTARQNNGGRSTQQLQVLCSLLLPSRAASESQ